MVPEKRLGPGHSGLKRRMKGAAIISIVRVVGIYVPGGADGPVREEAVDSRERAAPAAPEKTGCAPRREGVCSRHDCFGIHYVTQGTHVRVEEPKIRFLRFRA